MSKKYLKAYSGIEHLIYKLSGWSGNDIDELEEDFHVTEYLELLEELCRQQQEDE